MKIDSEGRLSEIVRLDQCEAGDIISVRMPVCFTSAIIKKIKPLPDGGTQIKYHSRWGKNPKVQKADFHKGATVERYRSASDDEKIAAGWVGKKHIIIEGTRYLVPENITAEQIDEMTRQVKAEQEAARDAAAIRAIARKVGQEVKRKSVLWPPSPSFSDAFMDRMFGDRYGR